MQAALTDSLEALQPVLTPLLAAYQAIDVDVGQEALFRYIRRDLFGFNDYLLFIVTLALAHSVPYYSINIFHTLLGWAFPKQVEKYRWCEGKHASSKLVRECILFVTAYHIIAPIAPIFLYEYCANWNPTMMTAPVPGIVTCILQIPLAYLVTDFLFYWGHRLLHWGPLYKAVHKKHHEFYVTVGWACEYAHPVEFIMGNVIPVIAGPILFRYHHFMFCVWMATAISGTTWGHSGYKFPIALSNGSHDFHHSHNVGNFGSMTHWDKICGTNGAYKAHLKRQAADASKKKQK